MTDEEIGFLDLTTQKSDKSSHQKGGHLRSRLKSLGA
jgi:hypothetical protein